MVGQFPVKQPDVPAQVETVPMQPQDLAPLPPPPAPPATSSSWLLVRRRRVSLPRDSLRVDFALLLVMGSSLNYSPSIACDGPHTCCARPAARAPKDHAPQ